MLVARVRDFASARDWDQFHTPRNLVLALVGEVGELAAELQWTHDSEVGAALAAPGKRDAVASEMADVMTYLLRLADVLGIDLTTAVRDKLAVNDARYPVDRSRGSAEKCTAYE